MMAKTTNEPGNNAKVNWKSEQEMQKIVYRLKVELEQINKEYEEQGLSVITK